MQPILSLVCLFNLFVSLLIHLCQDKEVWLSLAVQLTNAPQKKLVHVCVCVYVCVCVCVCVCVRECV